MTQTSSQKKRLPIRRGRFIVPDDPKEKPFLIGSKCSNCGKYFAGRRKVCLNCGKKTVERAQLSGKGKIYSYTIVHQQLPFALVKVPYAIVIVAFEEGCQTHGVVTENLDSVEVGKDVEVYFEVVREDEEGNELLIDKFRVVN
jgi:uncharacterized OB-fold protein